MPSINAPSAITVLLDLLSEYLHTPKHAKPRQTSTAPEVTCDSPIRQRIPETQSQQMRIARCDLPKSRREVSCIIIVILRLSVPVKSQAPPITDQRHAKPPSLR
jgi:hypothetical protein